MLIHMQVTSTMDRAHLSRHKKHTFPTQQVNMPSDCKDVKPADGHASSSTSTISRDVSLGRTPIQAGTRAILKEKEMRMLCNHETTVINL